jgi:hypothetical protein
LISPEDVYAEDGGGKDFWSVYDGTRRGLPDRLCHLLVIGRLIEAFGFLMMRVGVMSGC